ncbi:MAG: hypothetical protein ACK5NE_09485 [Brachymonas sp.]
MEVIATKQGYFGKLREAGERFDVPAGSRASWFMPADKAEVQKPKPQTSQGKGAKESAGDLV